MSEIQTNVELPVEENNQIEEASAQKMPVGTEADSIASVDKTDDAVKKAPSRKGDQSKQDPMPKTKAGMINAMYAVMSGMKKDQLTAAYKKMQEEFDLEDFEESEAVELPETSYDFSEDLNALVESEQTLSDEFKAKTAVIFETAIRSKLSEEVERLEDEYQSRLEEELNTTRSDLVEKIDSYLNYVVENWMEENQLAVESGLRTEIAEGFMNNLRELFVESYIDVPESKVDLVDELAEQVEDLEEKLNTQTASMLEMNESLETFQRQTIIREASRDLAETQVEKLASLVESLDFEDEESFAQKVKTVKESYFKKDVKETEEITEDWSAEDETVEVNTVMSQYLNAIKKTSK
jgi:hypothetical protein